MGSVKKFFSNMMITSHKDKDQDTGFQTETNQGSKGNQPFPAGTQPQLQGSETRNKEVSHEPGTGLPSAAPPLPPPMAVCICAGRSSPSHRSAPLPPPPMAPCIYARQSPVVSKLTSTASTTSAVPVAPTVVAVPVVPPVTSREGQVVMLDADNHASRDMDVDISNNTVRGGYSSNLVGGGNWFSRTNKNTPTEAAGVADFGVNCTSEGDLDINVQNKTFRTANDGLKMGVGNRAGKDCKIRINNNFGD